MKRCRFLDVVNRPYAATAVVVSVRRASPRRPFLSLKLKIGRGNSVVVVVVVPPPATPPSPDRPSASLLCVDSTPVAVLCAQLVDGVTTPLPDYKASAFNDIDEPSIRRFLYGFSIGR